MEVRTPPRRRVSILSLEGIVGSGKSTQMDMLKQLHRNDSRVVFVDEPVDEWNRLGLLDAMYDGRLDTGAFQLMALMSRIAPIQAAIVNGAKLLITERSPWSDHLVFARCNLTGVALDNYSFANARMHEALADLACIDVTFAYLKCTVDEGMARSQERARKADEAIPRAYMSALHEAHEEMMRLRVPMALKGVRAVVIDAMTDRGAIHAELVGLLENISRAVSQF